LHYFLPAMKRHPDIDILLNQIARYRKKAKLGRTEFGLTFTGDGHFIARLEQGREPRRQTVDRIRRKMARLAAR